MLISGGWLGARLDTLFDGWIACWCSQMWIEGLELLWEGFGCDAKVDLF